jgi:3-oxoadipate enol-lactonase
MPHAEVNGQRLFYEDTGGDRPVVAFSHGLDMDHSMFDPQVEALRDRYRCIAWDERCHGQTEGDGGRFSFWDSADDLVALLRSLGLERAVLAGMSQGGFLSLRAALRYPELVEGLVLIDTQAGTENPDNLPYYEQLLERWMNEGVDDELAGILEAIIIGPPGFSGIERWKQYWRELDRDDVKQAFTTLVGREDIHDRLGEIGAPALVVHGQEDAAIPMERAEALADGLADAESPRVDGGCDAAVAGGVGVEVVAAVPSWVLAGFGRVGRAGRRRSRPRRRPAGWS